MPFVEISQDWQYVSVYLNTLVTPARDVNPNAFSILTALPPKFVSTKNAAIHAQDYVATTQNVESLTILPLAIVLKAIRVVHWNRARSFQLKVENDKFNLKFFFKFSHTK
jgi:hypothetical protein